MTVNISLFIQLSLNFYTYYIVYKNKKEENKHIDRKGLFGLLVA